MTDAERAVSEAHDYVNIICRRMAPTEAHYKALHKRINHAIEAVRREAVDILKDARKHMVSDPAFINDQGDRDMLRRVEDYIRQHE